jgi:hypothetical protein
LERGSEQGLSGEHDQVGGLFSIFYCLIAYCLFFFVQRAPSMNLIFFITPFVLFVSLANYSLSLSQFYLIVRCAVWGHTRKDHCLAFYISIYGFVLHHEL